MTTQTTGAAELPEALRLADAIDPFVRKESPDHLTSKVAADALRRLHALSLELADQLSGAKDHIAAQVEALSAAQAGVPALREAVAKAIYEQWAYQDGWVKWVDRGNSLRQDDARDLADIALAAAPQPSPSPAPADPDGEAFRTAARLGLTLRFYGGCAQSSMPGTPSAYEVVPGGDRAEAMRKAVAQAAEMIACGGEAQRLDQSYPAPAQPGRYYGQLRDADTEYGKKLSVYSDTAPAQPVQDLHSVNDAVTIDLLNERVAYLEEELAKASAPAQPGQEGEALRQSLWLASEFTINRYLMSCADGHWSGAEKAQRHDELCRLYVAVFRGVHTDKVRRTHGDDWSLVHSATQELTDSLDEAIGFPVIGRPDYEDLAPKFFERFHSLATQALGAARAAPQPATADAELQGAYDSVPAHGDQQAVHIAGLRAVLAKWGQPQAVAGGVPVAWMDDGTLRAGSTATAHRVVTAETKAGMPKAAADSFTTPLYTTPPPQAVREPLTEEQIDLIAGDNNLDSIYSCIRAAERLHGITKGGQHGL